MNHPEVVDRLAILNAAHPRKLNEGLRHPSQLARSWYFFYFAAPGAARAPRARRRTGSSSRTSCATRSPRTRGGDRALHRGVVAARRGDRDDQLLPRRGAPAEGRRDELQSDLGAHPGHLGREATATSAPSSPSPTTTTCPTSTASSACPTPRTGSTTTRQSASTSCSSTSSLLPAQRRRRNAQAVAWCSQRDCY